MVQEKRTLAIEGRFRDFATKQFAKLRGSAKRTATSMVKSFTAAINPFTKLKAAIGGIVAVLAVRRAVGFFDQLRESLDVVGKTSDRLSITAESLQEVQFAGKLAGVELENIQTFFNDLSRNVEAARRGTKAQAEAFDLLGISVDDFAGQSIDATEAVQLIADGMANVENATERTNALLQIGGESATKLGALFASGSQGIARFAEEARALGLVFSREEIARAEQFNDEVFKLQRTFEAFFQRVFLEVAPVVTDFLRNFTEGITKDGDRIKQAAFDVAESIIGILQSVQIVFIDVKQFVTETVTFFEAFAKKAELALLGVQQVVSAGAVDNSQAIAQLKAEIRELELDTDSFGFAAEKTKDKVRQNFKEIIETLRAARDAGRQVQGGRTTTEVTADEPGFFDDFAAGITRGAATFQDFVAATERAGFQLVQGPMNAFIGSLGQVIEGTRSAKEAFREFGQQTLRIIGQIAARLLTIRVFSALFGVTPRATSGIPGAEHGGVTKRPLVATMPVRAFEGGGIATSPTLGIFGERSARRFGEAFIPLDRNRSVPVTMRGGGGGGVVNVTIHAIDAKGVRQMLIENRQTLGQLRASDFQNRVGQRQMIQRVVS